jgi:hypothetical protein
MSHRPVMIAPAVRWSTRPNQPQNEHAHAEFVTEDSVAEIVAPALLGFLALGLGDVHGEPLVQPRLVPSAPHGQLGSGPGCRDKLHDEADRDLLPRLPMFGRGLQKLERAEPVRESDRRIVGQRRRQRLGRQGGRQGSGRR